jgi:hypothetical protein
VLSEELIKEIEELAGCFFSIEEILEILEIRECTPEIAKVIRRGKLKSEAATRLSIFSLAQSGSGPAQTLAVKMIEEDKRKDY